MVNVASPDTADTQENMSADEQQVSHDAAQKVSEETMNLSEAHSAQETILGANPVIGLGLKDMLVATRRVAELLAVSPTVVASEWLNFAKEVPKILTNQSTIEGDPKDIRFKHKIFKKNPFFRPMAQTYLAWRQAMYNIIDKSDYNDLDKQRVKFVVSLFVEAVAPTNTFIGNPGAIDAAVRTKGKSIIRGLRNVADDVMNNGGMPSQVDESAFTLGKNVATTPGTIVYRSEVLELIQYKPQTDEVLERPVMLVPPQINKYYIVDIAEGRSFAEYAVKNGVQLFVISWRNPTAAQRDWGLEMYIRAVKESLDAVLEITGADSANVMAACAGGFTTATTVGYLEAIGEGHKINTLTLLVTVLDTSAPTLLGMFASEAGIAAAIRKSRKRGVLDGREMSRVFAWLRPNDLVWSFFMNNYLMGNKPPAFDVLYWNADVTRLPAEFHADILSIYQSNPLAKPGSMQIMGADIDMTKVKCDTYVIAGITDHITPWKACYLSPRLLGGKSEFVLSSSGHIQSIVNPPSNKKAKFYTANNESHLELEPEQWLDQADQHSGSWWGHWQEWMAARSGETKPAPTEQGSAKHPAGDPAPGRYVHQR